MKGFMYLTALTLILSFLFFPIIGAAQPAGPGPEGPEQGYEGWFCPWCGQSYGYGGYGPGPGMMGPGHGWGRRGYGMGPGMMHRGYGPGMGPGMMHRGYGGYGRGPGMMGPGYGYPQPYEQPQYQEPQRPLDRNDAEAILETYVRSTRNPNLKVGEIEEREEVFVAEIVTKDGSLVDKMMVDKQTGWLRSMY